MKELKTLITEPVMKQITNLITFKLIQCGHCIHRYECVKAILFHEVDSKGRPTIFSEILHKFQEIAKDCAFDYDAYSTNCSVTTSYADMVYRYMGGEYRGFKCEPMEYKDMKGYKYTYKGATKFINDKGNIEVDLNATNTN